MNKLLALLLMAMPAMAQETNMPKIPNEAEKIEALKLGYILNGMSMVREPSMGSIDISGPAPIKEQLDKILVIPPVVAGEPKR